MTLWRGWNRAYTPYYQLLKRALPQELLQVVQSGVPVLNRDIDVTIFHPPTGASFARKYKCPRWVNDPNDRRKYQNMAAATAINEMAQQHGRHYEPSELQVTVDGIKGGGPQW